MPRTYYYRLTKEAADYSRGRRPRSQPRGRPEDARTFCFRGAFVCIGFIYTFFSFFFRSLSANSFNLSLYYFNFASLAFLISELNWQYERLGMMMLIPYILSFGVFLNKFSYKIYLILTFTLLFFLTIYTGMYSVGLT